MNPLRRRLLLLPLAMLAGCGEDEAARGPEYVDQPPAGTPRVYRFAVHPLHNPRKLHQIFAPLVDYLGQRIPDARFELEASINYAHFEEKLKARAFDFALPNPYQTVLARDWGYRVIAKMGDDADFRGILLVRADSRIARPEDLRGKVVSYPAPTALAAAMMPQLYLQTHGLDINKEVENRYVGSQESSIMNVYLGQSAAGATWPPPWRIFRKNHPREAAALRVAWETPALINNSVMARADLPADLVDQVRLALLRLHEHAAGRAILAGMDNPRFDAASDRDYDRVVRFLDEFGAKVRPL